VDPSLHGGIDPAPPEEEQDGNGETGENSPRKAKAHGGRGYGLRRRPHEAAEKLAATKRAVDLPSGGDIGAVRSDRRDARVHERPGVER
jgi:hypothetical protein